MDDFDMDDFDMDYFNDNIITLTNEYGEEENFEFLDAVEYEGSEYVILLPVEEMAEDEAEVLILRIEATDDPDIDEYAAVDDEDVISAVFDIFKERNEEEYEF